ncbi:winged helix-turn-helix domain-containing protein [Salinirubrum litoreum]|uniref:Winged helix-turn-helix domain-containing protein n=1 Tax=Salinirubrum litoreum TaxID=1126234 RepID=A0ABD5RC86_9EURY|nr:helix-turn-helix domain-containing protein [Salinirubrum litoreum]
MTTDEGPDEASMLTPEEAFSVLGDDTRLGILQVLGEADEPLGFSDLFDRVEYDDPPNFNYHLKKLLGHFVDKTDSGYCLRQAGQRVVQAVLSGAVTEAPTLDQTPIDRACQHCGHSPIEVEYREEQVGMYCTQCAGQYGDTNDVDTFDSSKDAERIGYVHLPPAGVHGRTPAEMTEAAFIWTVAQTQALHRGVCPRCSAPVSDSVTVCETHEPTDGRCDRCDRRYAAVVHCRCENCPFELGGSAIGSLHTEPDLLAFLFGHGFDPFSSPFPSTINAASFEEELLGTEPLELQFRFTIGDDVLALTVDESLDVIESTTSKASTDRVQ